MKTEFQLHPLRTLIVDNSELFLTCLQRLLKVQGVVQVVGTAADGREAVEMAGKLTPDLVLMDLHMPGMDGLQATMLLRQQVPGSRIIIMTANETGSMASFCRDHGAHGFVSKYQMLNALPTEIERIFPTGASRRYISQKSKQGD
jgi:DNA-binding NarL/FixJ family response regulator